MMWMMGYSDGGELNSTIQDPFHGRKLRPLMPRPSAAAAAASAAPPACLTRIHGTDLLAINHHLAAMAEHNKRELGSQQVVVSSRWNPTPEQLQTLEDLYRRGTRTPSAEQIQHITSQLRRYGKIEGKNVFYWFQNHKARERQKRRRQLESLSDEQQQQITNHNNNNNNHHHTDSGEKRELQLPAGANRTAFEVEQTKNWASPTNSSTAAEKTVCAQGAAKAVEAEYKADGWAQFDDDAELLQQRRNATWQMVHLSPSSSPTNLIINSSMPAPTTVTSSCRTTTNTILPSALGRGMETKPLINIFLEPYNPSQSLDLEEEEEGQTLQLFPLRSGGRHCDCGGEEEEEESGADMGRSGADHHIRFFEFLPLKN